MSAAVSSFLTKALSPAYYQQAAKSMLASSYSYYHPLFRTGSGAPLFHAMIGISAVMYTTSYMARDYPAVQHKHEVAKKALHEYYEKHGGAPDHH